MRAIPVEEGVYLYFIPPSTWSVAEAGGLRVSLDITCRGEEGAPAVCNISFFGAEKTPEEVTAIAFTGEGGSAVRPLAGIKTMFVTPERNERRITSSIPAGELRKALEEETILLQFTLEGTRHTASPPELFLINKSEFLLHLR
jgi:hypothetical protein